MIGNRWITEVKVSEGSRMWGINRGPRQILFCDFWCPGCESYPFSRGGDLEKPQTLWFLVQGIFPSYSVKELLFSNILRKNNLYLVIASLFVCDIKLCIHLHCLMQITNSACVPASQHLHFYTLQFGSDSSK